MELRATSEGNENRVAADVDRLVVFVNPYSPHSLALADGLVAEARRTPAAEVVAVVDASAHRPPGGLVLGGWRLGTVLAQRIFEPDLPAALPAGSFDSPKALARRARVPLIVPAGRNLNHPEFCSFLRENHPGAVGVVIECLQVFGAELLGCFVMAVNYHNGRLPHFRGLGATSWSVYEAESASGFAFHRMETGIDTGPVLVEGAVPVARGSTTGSVEAAKIRAAASALPELLRAIRRRAPGKQQTGVPRSFSRRDLQRARTVEDPTALDREELDRRLRAFGVVEVSIGGAIHPTTAFTEGRSGGARSFATRDGVVLEPYRCLHLPFPLYRVVAPLLRRWKR